MSDRLPVLERGFVVRYFETDWMGLVRSMTLLDYLQEAAAEHARLLGVSVQELRSRGLAWVLSRLHLQVERYPGEGEKVDLTTWPSTREGIFSCREFELFDGSGEIFARATTSWAVIDVETRRPVKVDARLPYFPVNPKRAVADNFATIPRLEAAGEGLTFRALRSHLDVNRHVNNTLYARWALETVPGEVAETMRPSAIEIGFRAEAFAGDVVTGYCGVLEEGEEPLFLHRLDGPAGKELTRLRTRWRKV